ncbi:hypothetical protein PtA15_13A313 [Puccinia triticina]|uniref:Uncharacterized protein n=1 Tax=Puccinia triticina TaxID=208348 RepID=A0ABY7D2U0_9BASI|nr:uncharacterized protein PtA15_13A313 [Puccinia triticina]WAQ90913.1 hypothetical protein PtA15_13A313 [Puccinia triticina]WAR61099.1 hypothetical protein PtB15_13B351 [Puccinia triticina]
MSFTRPRQCMISWFSQSTIQGGLLVLPQGFSNVGSNGQIQCPSVSHRSRITKARLSSHFLTQQIA